MKLLIMGPPGVGKGTQASLLKKRLNIIHLSTGDILRDEISKNSKIGHKAQSYMNEGKLVPDQVLLDIIADRIVKEDCDNGFLLDGFPRTLKQAVGLDRILDSIKQLLDFAISLTANEEELITRLINRGAELGRSDDTPEVIRNRQKVYWANTAPLLDFYKDKHILREVDGLGDIDIITNRILKSLK
jgi:adenylate kinase